MLKKQISFLLFLFLISQAVYPNAKLFPGYYIAKNGDSVFCNIEFNDWNLNPKTIHVQVKNESREFGPGDIKGFGVYGYNDYISSSVTYHNSPVSGRDIPQEFSDNLETKTYFLKIVEQGPYSLYDLILPDRVYLFLNSPDSTISELVYRAKDKNDTLVADPVYRKQLFSLFMKEGISSKYFNQVNNSPYTASGIASLFIILNENHTGIKHVSTSLGDFQAEIFIGAVNNKFPTAIGGIYISANQFQPSASFSGGLNFLYSIPGNFNAFKVGLSLGYNSYSGTVSQFGTSKDSASPYYYSSTKYNESLTSKNSLLMTNIYVMYFVNPLNRIKFYVKAGLNYSFSLGGDANVYSSYQATTTGVRNGNPPEQSYASGDPLIVTIKHSFVSLSGGVGIKEGRSSLEFSYMPPVNIANNNGGQSDPLLNTFKFGSMGVFYYFALFPEKSGGRK